MFLFEWKFALDGSSIPILLCFMMAIIHCTDSRSRYRVAECTQGTWQIYYIYLDVRYSDKHSHKKYTILLLVCFKYKRVCFVVTLEYADNSVFHLLLYYVYCIITCASTFSVLYLQTVREDEVNEYNMVRHRVKYILKCL